MTCGGERAATLVIWWGKVEMEGVGLLCEGEFLVTMYLGMRIVVRTTTSNLVLRLDLGLEDFDNRGT